MSILLVLLQALSISVSHAQYEDYEGYQNFGLDESRYTEYGFAFTPSLIYLDITEDNQYTGGTATDRSRTVGLYDLRLGYFFRRGFYFGMAYSLENQKINQSGVETDRTSIGMTLGYKKRGWTLFATYFLHSAQTLENTSDNITDYSKGSGFQFDFSYHFKVSPFFSLGPMVTYKSFQYKEAQNSSNSTTDASSTHSALTPMLSLMFHFVAS